MTPDQIRTIIAKAIQSAFVEHPDAGHGKTWDQQYKTNEESEHLAKAVLLALDKAGLAIGQKGNQ